MSRRGDHNGYVRGGRYTLGASGFFFAVNLMRWEICGQYL